MTRQILAYRFYMKRPCVNINILNSITTHPYYEIIHITDIHLSLLELAEDVCILSRYANSLQNCDTKGELISQLQMFW